jgi:hypothetical protein
LCFQRPTKKVRWQETEIGENLLKSDGEVLGACLFSTACPATEHSRVRCNLLTLSTSKFSNEPSMVVHTCNLSIQEAEAGGSPVQGQPVLLSETSSQKKKKKSFQINHIICEPFICRTIAQVWNLARKKANFRVHSSATWPWSVSISVIIGN